jgi:dipeptidyl aminopeptidase/acylaminoacyl peptidase
LDGSRLWICGGRINHRSDCSEVWRGNEWVKGIETGTAKQISYSTSAGKQLVGWLLLPHSYLSNHRLPVVTIIYPGLIYTASTRPSSFSLFWNDSWQAPELFAALGYAVLLPSVPDASNQNEIVDHLPDVVIPAIDAIISQGIADPDRIAIVGQSDGGFGVLSLITQTNRFRSAISSAGFSDLISLYGTFYGQYRNGDAGPPEKAQLLRMLQMEDGSMGLGGPPWRDRDEYLAVSPIFRADKVETPLMLIHGDMDFIPIQQDEEFFTALLRQNKPVEFVRYQSEWHTISAHADVIDLWKRVANWLSETMAAHK